MSKYKFGDLVELKRGGEWQLGVVTSVENCDGFKLYVVALKKDNGRQWHVAEFELHRAAKSGRRERNTAFELGDAVTLTYAGERCVGEVRTLEIGINVPTTYTVSFQTHDGRDHWAIREEKDLSLVPEDKICP